MKKKIISAVLAAILVITSAMPAFATPNQEVIENQKKYDELTQKIEDINNQIYTLNGEIEPLVQTIESNNAQMEQIKVEVANTEKEIEAAKEEIAKTEEVLGKRIRELYKSGGQSSYIMLLFSADSFNDLISKIESTSRLVNIDKKMVKELEDKQDSLNEKIASLDEKDKELTKVNEETQKSLSEFEAKKAEQEALVAQVQAEQAEFEREFLAVSERQLVTPQFSVIDNSSSSIDELNSAISQLRNIRDNQIKSGIVKEEINNKIEAAKEKVSQLQAAIDAANAASKPNRGDSTVSATGNAIVDYAYQFLGTPYLWGGTTPSGFDCSGFTQYVFKNAAGISLPRTTYDQINVGVAVSYNNLQPGDLVFPHTGHVGIYIGGGQMIHAPSSGDVVKVSSVYKFYTARRVV
ncbi:MULTISPECIES: C40 family peptidase [unclassified Clostridium]|uniref:C40 family peptidase n=1 Tax=unclassified Clostridium TaxID=2614128 RepID=UPI0018986DBB|nr:MULTISPECIES: C40 family peptidase [unclassified Clostridium]MBP3914616.1 C40 family peptidase [Clostridium sp.]MEE0933965.1 NlpC/P60 family protein [Clostridium sp.]